MSNQEKGIEEDYHSHRNVHENSNGDNEERPLLLEASSSVEELPQTHGVSPTSNSITSINNSDSSLSTSPSPSSDSPPPSAAVNSVIEYIGMGKFQRKLFYLCGAGWLIDNLWLQVAALSLPYIQTEFQLSSTYAGVATTSALIGMMFGALFWGWIADRYGRKIVFNATLLLCALFGFCAGFAMDVYSLCFCFSMMGFGVGGNLPIDGSLFLEFVTKDAQSQLVMLSLFWPIGQVITSVYSWILIPLFPGCTPPTTQCSPSLTHGWRYVIFAAGITTFFMFFLRFFVFQMLESPKYLLGRGRRDEAIRVLRKLAAENHSGSTTPIDFSPAEFENLLNSLPMVVVKSPLLNLDFSKKLYEFNKSFKPLFTRNIRRTTILVWLIWACVSMAYTMFYAFLFKLLKDAPASNVFSAEIDYIIISLFGVPGSLMAMYAVDQVSLGRKGTMVLSTFITAVSLLSFALTTTPILKLASNCLNAFASNVMYGVIYSYTPEVFPTKVRGTASGIASCLARVTGAVSPSLTGFLLGISATLPLFVSVALFLLDGVLMILLPIETHGQAAL